MYGELLRLVADDNELGGQTVPVLAGHEDDPGPSALALRLVVAERAGCDIAPIDPTTADGALTLTAYVWPDQDERLARLRGALEIAREVPAEVRRQGAPEFIRGLELVDGAVTVLWHSIMWQYLSRDDQADATAAIDALGESATDRRPFAHLYLEPVRPNPGDERAFHVMLQTWPSGERRSLGVAAPHGVPVVWS